MSNRTAQQQGLSIAIAVIGLLLFCFFILPLGFAPRHDNDFKHLFLGSTLIIKGISPYSLNAMSEALGLCGLSPKTPLNPFVYLPFTGLVLSPLTWLNLRQASDVWFWINIFCTLSGIVFISLSCASSRNGRLALFGGTCTLLAFSHPLMRTLTAGQLNCVLFLCVAGGFYYLKQQRNTVCAGLLSFAALFKIAPGFFLIHFLLTKSRRLFSLMLAFCVALGLGSIIACGPAMNWDFLPTLRDMGFGNSTWQEYGNTFWKDATNQSLNSFFTHILVAENGVTNPWLMLTQPVANVATWFSVLIIFGLYARAAWKSQTNESSEGAFQLAILCSLLLPSLYWDHYAILTVLPCCWTLVYACRHRMFITVGLITAMTILLHIPWNYGATEFQSGFGIILMSSKLFPTLGIYAIALFFTFISKKDG